jgi:hypothetical protein
MLKLKNKGPTVTKLAAAMGFVCTISFPHVD